MFPTLLYLSVYVFSILFLVWAFLIMGRGGARFFLSLSIGSFGVAASLLLYMWDRFDWLIFYLGLFNLCFGLVCLIPVLRNLMRRRNVTRFAGVKRQESLMGEDDDASLSRV